MLELELGLEREDKEKICDLAQALSNENEKLKGGYDTYLVTHMTPTS